MTTSEPIEIAIRDLGYTIEGKEILFGVNFVTDANRIGIVGRNGSGKSTLARLISGLVEPSQGSVSLGSIDPAKDRRAALKTVGVLFQNPDHQIIFPTVIEELMFGLLQLGHSKSDARTTSLALLERFGKSHWADAATHALSQGQKHLLCLMSVILMQPRLIVLDEPFAGLDLPTKMQLSRYLSRYDGQLLHISHDPQDLEGYDEVIWIDAGRLKAQGSAAETLDLYFSAMRELGDSDDIADLSR